LNSLVSIPVQNAFSDPDRMTARMSRSCSTSARMPRISSAVCSRSEFSFSGRLIAISIQFG
jgi:hypothetical protein